jgi:hypothetical protein
MKNGTNLTLFYVNGKNTQVLFFVAAECPVLVEK